MPCKYNNMLLWLLSLNRYLDRDAQLITKEDGKGMTIQSQTVQVHQSFRPAWPGQLEAQYIPLQPWPPEIPQSFIDPTGQVICGNTF